MFVNVSRGLTLPLRVNKGRPHYTPHNGVVWFRGFRCTYGLSVTLWTRKKGLGSYLTELFLSEWVTDLVGYGGGRDRECEM